MVPGGKPYLCIIHGERGVLHVSELSVASETEAMEAAMAMCLRTDGGRGYEVWLDGRKLADYRAGDSLRSTVRTRRPPDDD